MNPPVLLNLVSQFFHLFLERIVTQEFNNLRDLCQGWPHFVPFPEKYRDVRNIKVEGKLAFGELQIQPSGLNPVAPRPADIRVFLPGNKFFSL